MNFTDLQLHPIILQALKDMKFEEPTEIQKQAIPVVLARKDVLGCAQTGTGKTAAFVLPIAHQIITLIEEQTISKKELKCLILAPTRELAIQIHQFVEAALKYSNVRHAVVFGGVDLDQQIDQMKKIHPQILVATPGRFLDIYGYKFITLKHIKFLVLDEADRMLDMGFQKELNSIIKLLPKGIQTSLFSATLTENIKTIAKSILRKPVYIEVSPSASTSTQIQQVLYPVNEDNKITLMIYLIKKLKPKSMIVFTKTKAGADELVVMLKKENLDAEALHSNRSQNVRIRLLEQFRKNKLKVLVATDIASRGIDVEGIQFVVNYDVPLVPEIYTHRVGRTGRASATGKAFTLVTPRDWNLIEKILTLTQQEIPVETQHPYIIPLSFMKKKEEIQPVILPKTTVKKKKITSKERRKKKASKDKNQN
jgi:ATP-dependent RNA helicase RhlE